VSVIARVRSISEELHGALLRDRPEIATRLALEREAIDSSRENEHASVWTELAAANVRRSDVDVAFEVGRAGLGLGWAFAGSRATLFDEGAGVPVGEDVGYGPSRLFTPAETKTIYDAMLSLPIATFASQYERASQAAPGDPYVSFEAVVVARVGLAEYMRVAKVSWRALLVWCD
jgi:hypothetical protein